MEIVVVTGPSGSGKTHLIHELTELGVYPLEVYTDRPRRRQEKIKTDRVYLTKKEFNSQKKEFLYWFAFQGNRYGYKKGDIAKQKRADKNICFNIVPKQLTGLLMKLPSATVIYLNVRERDFSFLQKRMEKRDIFPTDTEKSAAKKLGQIESRLVYAREELRRLSKIKKAILINPKSKIFKISDDEGLYKQVLPYIKQLLEKD